MSIHESSRVAYAGDDTFQVVGSLGKVVALAGTGAHILWEGGPREGMVELVDLNDLVPAGSTASQIVHTARSSEFEDSLEMASPPAIQVRATYDDQGEDGLVNALESAGRIAMLDQYAEEAVVHVATRMRQDPAFSEVLAALEPDEAASLVNRVCATVLMDRVSEG